MKIVHFFLFFLKKEMISIEINNIIYRSYNFKKVNKIGNNILLEKYQKKTFNLIMKMFYTY